MKRGDWGGGAWGQERCAAAAPPGNSSQTERQETASPGQHWADDHLSESGFCPDEKPEVAQAHPEDSGTHPV